MVTTKQKPIVGTQKVKVKESKHSTKESHQITKEGRNRRRKGQRGTTKVLEKMNKMAINTYLSIITLNVDGLYFKSKDTEWLNGYKSKTHLYTAYKRLTSNVKTHTD